MKLDTSSYYPKSPLDGEEYTSCAAGGQSPETGQSTVPETELVPGSEPSPQSAPSPRLEPAPTGASQTMDGFSTAMSWIMVPLLMPVYGMLLAFGLSILNYVPAGTKLGFTLVVAALNILVPALLILTLKKMGAIRDVGLNNRDERLWPYVISIICLGGTALFVAMKGAPMWLTMFFAGGAVAGIVELIVNHWWKISVHAPAGAHNARRLSRSLHIYMALYLYNRGRRCRDVQGVARPPHCLAGAGRLHCWLLRSFFHDAHSLTGTVPEPAIPDSLMNNITTCSIITEEESPGL